MRILLMKYSVVYLGTTRLLDADICDRDFGNRPDRADSFKCDLDLSIILFT